MPDSTAEVNEEVARLLDEAGRLNEMGRNGTARAVYCQAVLQDRSYTARVELGRFLVRTESYAEAREHFCHLLAASKRLANERLQATAAHNLAVVYRYLGRGNLAARFQQESLEIETRHLEGSRGSRWLSYDLSGRANDALLAGDYQLAETLFRTALCWESRYGTRQGEANDRASLGVLAGLQGMPADAIRWLWSAYRLHRRGHHTEETARDLIHLADQYRTLGRWKLAVRCLQRSVDHLQRRPRTSLHEEARRRLEETSRWLAVLTRDPRRN